MVRLLWTARKARVCQITTFNDCGKEKSISELTHAPHLYVFFCCWNYSMMLKVSETNAWLVNWWLNSSCIFIILAITLIHSGSTHTLPVSPSYRKCQNITFSQLTLIYQICTLFLAYSSTELFHSHW